LLNANSLGAIGCLLTLLELKHTSYQGHGYGLLYIGRNWKGIESVINALSGLGSGHMDKHTYWYVPAWDWYAPGLIIFTLIPIMP